MSVYSVSCIILPKLLLVSWYARQICVWDYVVLLSKLGLVFLAM